jgi:hypothetical protein
MNADCVEECKIGVQHILTHIPTHLKLHLQRCRLPVPLDTAHQRLVYLHHYGAFFVFITRRPLHNSSFWRVW